MEATLWVPAERNGENRTQKEPQVFKKPIVEVVPMLQNQCKISLRHRWDVQWFKLQAEIKEQTFLPSELNIKTDFSATPSLEAPETDTCSEAQHCVLPVFIVQHNPREVDIMTDEGTIVKRRINDCTYWTFLGPTDGPGKKNDHRFHQACLDHIVQFHAKEELKLRNVVIDLVTLTTDNCSGQYKSQFNMYQTAAFPAKHPGISLQHGYAPVYTFKGVHDGWGKIVKRAIAQAELRGDRIPTARAAFEYLSQHPMTGMVKKEKWEELETNKSSNLLKRGPSTMTACIFGYVADNKVDFE